MSAQVPESVIAIDGEVVPAERALVSVHDHGFLFGDSVYDVVATQDGVPFASAAHLDRLGRSAEGIGLDIPWERPFVLDAIATAIAARSWEGESAVRVVVTRGVGPLDISPEGCDRPRLIVIAFPRPIYPKSFYDDGITLAVVSRMRNPTRSLDPGIKSGNYLNNMLALREARRVGATDAVMLNEHGQLTECTTSNLFFVREGILRTPALRCGLLAGVTRGHVIDLCREDKITLLEGNFGVQELLDAQEAFITSTTKGVLPVRKLGAIELPGDGPGEVTARLAQLYGWRVEELVDAERADWRERIERCGKKQGSPS